MARPQKEGMDYFPHDTDAVNDEKLEALRALYGNDGYAFYFILLERIYRNPNAELDVSAPETFQILARKVSVTDQKFSEMMDTALKWRCFDLEKYQNHHVLTSNGVKRRALPVHQKRIEMRARYHQTPVSSPVSSTETLPETPQSKEKESKEKNSIVYSIYTLWNNQNIIVHKKLTEDIARVIKTAIKNNTKEDIVKAMENYSEIQKGEQYYFKHAWTLKDFLNRGIAKFLDLEIAKRNYLKNNEEKDGKAQPNVKHQADVKVMR